jgi:hypothetical protein
MTLVAAKAGLRRVEKAIRARDLKSEETIARLKADPTHVLTANGLTPDPWQAELLRSEADNTLICCSRQAGKSTTSAARAVNVALCEPGSLVLMLSPSLRQSGELFRKAVDLYLGLGSPVRALRQNTQALELANGSRIVSLPATESTIRGYSKVRLLLVDEASRVDDSLYYAIRPTLAVSQGQLIALSTPFGQRGWFHSEWVGTADWKRVQVTAHEIPRITPEFLAEELAAMGEKWFGAEYLCQFTAAVDCVFDYHDIQAALSDDVAPLFAA